MKIQVGILNQSCVYADNADGVRVCVCVCVDARWRQQAAAAAAPVEWTVVPVC